MAPFMFPPIRRRKAEWLMGPLHRGPRRLSKAQISYVGHSTGHYLLVDALRRYPAAKFKHVVFAGSVVRFGFSLAGLYDGGATAALVAGQAACTEF
jgi:hypothetical protein